MPGLRHPPRPQVDLSLLLQASVSNFLLATPLEVRFMGVNYSSFAPSVKLGICQPQRCASFPGADPLRSYPRVSTGVNPAVGLSLWPTLFSRPTCLCQDFWD